MFRTRSRGGVYLAVGLWTVPLAFFGWRARLAARPAALTTGAPAPARRPPPPPGTEQEVRGQSAQNFAALQNLPYILQSYDPNPATGIIKWDRARTSPGVNFIAPWCRGAPRAYLMDMDGKVLWRWQIDAAVFRKENPWLEHAELLPDGSVVFTLKDLAVVKVDRDSKIVWRISLRAHHDVWPAGNGDLLVLSRTPEIVPAIHPTLPIEADAITFLDPNGSILRKIPILPLLERSGYRFLLPRLEQAPIPASIHALDVFHTNHVESFDGRLAARSPIYARGNLLVSIRNLNAIAIVDPRVPDAEKIVWLWGPGNLTYQHDPRLLPDGHILVFDNGTERSQLIEVDPLTDRVVWRYAPSKGFFSKASGAAQRLANGNTLVTESMTGHVFEISPTGDIVWKYAGPDINHDGIRDGIIRMTRFDPAQLSFLPATG
ncbi:MAG TPA: arylsulfotransferase family protein [Thermoanaerobaculia bacterium]|nr:arylsulfotransferase family protein [Thermoanaerobaculia bacterium]